MRRVGDVMAAPVVLEHSATVQEASTRMLEAGSHAALVVRDGAVSGIVTADGVSAALAEGHSAADTPVGMIADGEPLTFGPDEVLADAHQLMRSTTRAVAAVVGAKREPLGILRDDEAAA
jgi:predicted transcriptional regulator